MRTHKQSFFLSVVFLLVIGLLTACGSGPGDLNHSGAHSDAVPATRVYHGENGDVRIPAHPQRIAVLAHIYVGNVLKLGITPIAVNEWVKENAFFQGKLDGVEVVTEDSIEKLLELNPDLIITYTSDKNLKKYAEIAPTVALTNDKYSYLEQHIEIGKIVGKEKEAQAWVDEWNAKAKIESEKVKAAIGENVTITVLESFGKDIYVYGNNWGRGTEVIYQALGIKAPQNVEADVFGQGYKAISSEVIPQYAGDYIFVGGGDESINNSFMETDVWKNIPAVQKKQVIPFDSKSFWFNDAISLEKQMEFIVKELTKSK
ncbi:MAG TPA: iron-hydroxamate ABC transporter substrate-binding protein [Candidatus Bathyarchaeia archaeon]|nr:iron-hydroxamate ABC transporter substrate-binding protein [Candidatus Bathyarchaeia archaeon]